MVESRCGILCGECEYRDKMNCESCVHIDKPFWGDSCPVKSCCEGKGLEHCGNAVTFPAICSTNSPMTKNRAMMESASSNTGSGAWTHNQETGSIGTLRRL